MEQKYIQLYDEYTHSTMSRRTFIERLTRLAGGTTAAMALLPLLENNYARAETIAKDDSRLSSDYVEYPGGESVIRAYLAKPKDTSAPLPGVVIIHENKGLHPHIEDVARRAALAGFIALAPDGLSPLGGTPGDQDKARGMIAQLDGDKARRDFEAAVSYVKKREDCNGKVGCVGFCWGGAMANQLAAHSQDLSAAVAFYGRQASAADAARIKVPLQLHYAGLDDRINQGIPDYREALDAAGARYELHMYEGVNHAFHNDANASRYDAKAAQLAWERTIAFLKQALA
ncbi:Dienelactone hydrolase and related enzyme [Hahella chejuensis KCTC 2396]|uniref:Dienelactone hydrolase and related enzyme n=1 Tax=Hahella chejuensis (strain KCTC 2396) TaxID=349521 RepID=Q2SQN4_HAHCH|nr:dienelactone hydrolase family protein [Hahella chejuensis]ABC27040.1 Dienelactone hydrolase and related enzyme [Hahella chejuensis KCTC 2396]